METYNLATGEVGVTNDLALIERARAALAEAETLDECLEARDKVHAVERYLRRKDGAEKAAHHASVIRLRAERRIGELLKEGGERRGAPLNSHGGSSTPLPTGVTHSDSHRWQRIADLPKEEFEDVLSTPEPTTAGLLKRWRSLNAPGANQTPTDTCTVDDLARLVSTGTKFGTVYADPPWQYGNQGTRAATDNHYGTMTVEAIRALPVRDLAGENSHCHLWTTNAFLRDAFDVLESWGFTYKSLFVWVKPEMGIGNYWRVSHELMLFGIRGKAPFVDRGLKSWIEAPRTEHSRKPEQVRALIERASPGPYLEMFGRRVAPGWTVWGNEIERGLLDSEARSI